MHHYYSEEFDDEEIIDADEVTESDSETEMNEWWDVDTDGYEFGDEIYESSSEDSFEWDVHFVAPE